MTAFKKAVLFVHRWLGFVSGLVVFIVSITGCLFCFQDEIQDAIYDYRKVAVSNAPYLKPTDLQQAALKQFPKGKAGMVAYMGADRSAQVRLTDEKKAQHFMYFNPYTGKYLSDENPRTNFFIIVEFIHLYLLLPPKIGKVVVGVAVLIFVMLMITGIVLWWPKRKSDRKRSFTVKWNGRWRRVNYDLHNVLGFYSTAIALILAITGLSMSFEWMEKGIYKAGNLGKSYAAELKEFKSDSLNKGNVAPEPIIDKAYAYIRKQSPNALMYMLYEGAGADGALHATAYAQPLKYAFNDYYTFDKYTGKLLNYMPHAKKSTGMKLNNMNYDIHVGQIAGLPGKIIAFIASLICASLPITGLIIYLGKRKKPKAKRLRQVTHHKSQRHLQVVTGKKAVGGA
ncbi:PepSY-associated TM helix domain-containing protein [Mucilaginibacter sp. PAMB04168]|uniref:PepSY-associated TM helix domain-containing protein n=1 Tax=Mucilaginibacter sp. PAMB04168 TaxID=3138567 RepID=UPI0031F677EC